MSQHDAAAHHADAHHGDAHYYKVYFTLLALLTVSILGPMIGIKAVTPGSDMSSEGLLAVSGLQDVNGQRVLIV